MTHGEYSTAEPTGWERYLAELVADKLVILGLEVLASMTRRIADLGRWGARKPICVASGVGTGSLPNDADADVVVLPAQPAASITEDARHRMTVPELPDHVVRLIESRDPRREALWWLSPVNLTEPILERAVIGGRPRAQAALEDKMLADALWDEAAVVHAPTRIVRSEPDALAGASDAVRRESGTEQVVWSGDARDGINGGADYVRLITDRWTADRAAAFFGEVCDRVRVMPFLNGVPCSIHGMVLDDGVAVLRPVELSILRDPARARFVVAGLGTLWDPPGQVRREMRAAARRVGELLSERYAYRGGFGVDGVATADGFRPTELNPRFSAGLSRLSRAAPDLQLELLQLNLQAGRSAAIPARGYEEIALEMLDEQRFVDANGVATAGQPTSGPARSDSTECLPVVVDGDAIRACRDGEQQAGEILAGPSTMGRFVRLTVIPEVVTGARCAELSRQVLALADERWGLGFGPLEIAPDVCR
jgi:hypothetical protein